MSPRRAIPTRTDRRSRVVPGRGRRRRRRAVRRPASDCRGTPVNSTGSPAARRVNEARRGPSPAMTRRASTPSAINPAQVSMLRSTCFSTDRRPQCTSRCEEPPRQASTVVVLRRRGWNRSRSTPRGTRWTLVAPIRSNSARANAVVQTTASYPAAVRALAMSAAARAHRAGITCPRRRSRRSWLIITDAMPRRRAQGPSPRSVSRSETSRASGARPTRRSVTRRGSATRYPPVPGIPMAGTVMRATPESRTSSDAVRPGTITVTLWP